VLRIEVLIGVIASAIAILTFMARAYANIRRGRRIKRYSDEFGARSDEELRRLQEEIAAAEEMTARRRKRRRRKEPDP
jgi:hypothetical protein